jgi:hypothetical protein
MRALKHVVLAATLALPLVALGAVQEVPTPRHVEATPQIQNGPAAGECCWVYYYGNWYCVAYC